MRSLSVYRCLRSTALFFLALLSMHSATAADSSWHALILSDTHVLPSPDSQTSYYESDTGRVDLWPSAKSEMTSLISKTQPKFILVLGDLPGHDLSLSDMAAVDKQVFGDISSIASQRPWFYVTGNNDSLTGDYHSFSHVDSKGQVTNVLSLVHASVPGSGVAASCEEGDFPCIIDSGNYNNTPYFFGFYSAYPTSSHRLRLIALNTVLWLSARYSSDDGVSQKDAGDSQMQWLKQQLASAKAAGERVLLAMHVPSGLSSYSNDLFWQEGWEQEWEKLLNQYQSSIVLIVNGHTHMNALRVTRTDNGSLLSLTIPGITPLHHNNPGMDELSFSHDASGHLVWRDGRVYAYSSTEKRWTLLENIREAYVPSCHDEALLSCLNTVSESQFNAVLDRYYLLREGQKPHESWTAVNEAAHETLLQEK